MKLLELWCAINTDKLQTLGICVCFSMLSLVPFVRILYISMDHCKQAVRKIFQRAKVFELKYK